MATLTLNGSTSGNVVVTVPAISGTGNTVTIPATTGTLALASTSTSGGIFFGGASSGVLYQDASNLYWDDTNNRLGIGTNSPGYTLDAVGVNFRFGASSNPRFNVTNTGGTASDMVIGADSGISWIGSANTNSPVYFMTNGTERMRVLSTGNILCLSGGSTTATGTGIAFPATQSASSNANTLDDYEEGTYTPTVKAGVAGATLTYSTQYVLQSSAAGGANSDTISYVKIGKVVYLAFLLRLVQAGISARMYVSLPFPIDGSLYGCSGSVGLYNWNQTLNQGTYIANGANGVEAFDLGAGNGTHANLVSYTNSEIYFNFHYYTTT